MKPPPLLPRRAARDNIEAAQAHHGHAKGRLDRQAALGFDARVDCSALDWGNGAPPPTVKPHSPLHSLFSSKPQSPLHGFFAPRPQSPYNASSASRPQSPYHLASSSRPQSPLTHAYSRPGSPKIPPVAATSLRPQEETSRKRPSTASRIVSCVAWPLSPGRPHATSTAASVHPGPATNSSRAASPWRPTSPWRPASPMRAPSPARVGNALRAGVSRGMRVIGSTFPMRKASLDRTSLAQGTGAATGRESFEQKSLGLEDSAFQAWKEAQDEQGLIPTSEISGDWEARKPLPPASHLQERPSPGAAPSRKEGMGAQFQGEGWASQENHGGESCLLEEAEESWNSSGHEQDTWRNENQGVSSPVTRKLSSSGNRDVGIKSPLRTSHSKGGGGPQALEGGMQESWSSSARGGEGESAGEGADIVKRAVVSRGGRREGGEGDKVQFRGAKQLGAPHEHLPSRLHSSANSSCSRGSGSTASADSGARHEISGPHHLGQENSRKLPDEHSPAQSKDSEALHVAAAAAAPRVGHGLGMDGALAAGLTGAELSREEEEEGGEEEREEEEEGDEGARLVRAFERLSNLKAKCRVALSARASEAGAGGRGKGGGGGAFPRARSRGGLEEIERLYKDLNRARDDLEGILWPIIRDFLPNARDRQETLLAAVRVIEMLEQQEQGEGEKEEGGGEEGMSQVYRDRCFEQMEKGVDERFRDLLERMVHGKDVELILKEASAITSDLVEVSQFVAPCFPPLYEVLSFLRQLYMLRFVKAGQMLSTRAKTLTNKEILQVLGWSSWLKTTVKQMGVAEGLAAVPMEFGALDPLVDEYMCRMGKFLDKCLTNLLELEAIKEGEEGDGDGGDKGEFDLDNDIKGEPLRAVLPVDVFRLLNGEVEEARTSNSSLLLSQLGKCLAQALQDLLQKLSEDVASRLPAPGAEMLLLSKGHRALLCVANNSVVSQSLADQLEGEVMSTVEPRHAPEVQPCFKEVKSGFQKLAKDASRAAVLRCFQIEHFKNLVDDLYVADGGDGKELEVTELLGAVEELLSLWRPMMVPEAFALCAEAALERLVLVYVERLVNQKMGLSIPLVWRMQEDLGIVQEIFTQHLPRKTVDDRIQILQDLGDVAGADSVETFVLGYKSLLASTWPQCAPTFMKRLAVLRTSSNDFTQAESVRIVEQCWQIWKDQQAGREKQLSRATSFLQAAAS